ncbi:MAG: type II toxin-antitoxin system VapC family toxin [Longimicrobiales bacterium]|nr:type II toxin-antitoxin system VapC family toxin [Longimicrobiales bacterium]
MADASALVELLLRTPFAAPVEEVLTDEESDLHVPALCDVEAAAALRRLSLAGMLDDVRREEALVDYADLPITRHGHLALLPRILELRQNFSAYDATYVALAERLEAELLTADRRLARAVGTHTDLAVLPSE